jgi:MFS family permease
MTPARPTVSPWRFITAFGVVSLLADLVYEGARSVTGPYLATLGASAALVGLVTGAGEAVALAGRVISGPLVDRTRAYWPVAIAGYALTVAAVPLLGLTTALWAAAALVVAERAGKALRSPAKDVLLSAAASSVGRGRGFAVHEALDQIGAVGGPLIVAAVLAVTAGNYRVAFLILAVPGVAVLAVLTRLRLRVPDPLQYEAEPTHPASAAPDASRSLPARFWRYAAFTALTATGSATFGVLAFHLATTGLVAPAGIPLIYAAAMGVDAAVALGNGWAYDRWGPRVLFVVPVLSALVPALAFTGQLATALLGVLLWGAVTGVQESTMRAAVADLVPTARRGAAYGMFAVVFGTGTLLGGLLFGVLYQTSIPALVAVVAVLQVAAFAFLIAIRRQILAR